MNAIVTSSVILAAGMGIRMERRGKRMPKGFLCLGDQPIIEESISRLLEVGVRRIVIVTGHLAGFYHALQARYPDIVQLVHNPYYADSGSMYSLYCARRYVREDFLLLESDLIYERQALTTLLEYPEDNVVLLSGCTKTSDEVFVQTNSGCLMAMSKDRDALGPHVAGELVGISKISQRLYRVMLQKAVERFHTTRHMDYETDCLVAAAQNVLISCPVVEDLVWCEIDDETHLARARNKIYPAVQRADVEAGGGDSQRLRADLSKFKTVGFFEERDLIIRHMHDFFTTVNEHQVRACIMFGTLLGKLRHNDFIPWDDDVDIVVFDFDVFLEQCVPELERQGYTVEPDVRDGQRMGCRIFREDSAKVPGKPRVRFPWIGIWEHEVGKNGLIVLPPEAYQYRQEDFLPLVQKEFLGATVGVPQNPTAILNTYFGAEDWMDVCQLPYRDHRNGGELTGFPDDKFNVQTVLEFLATGHSLAGSEAGTHDAR